MSRNPLKKEVEPRLPVSRDPHILEQFEISRAVFLEEQRQVQDRIFQQSFGPQDQSDEQATNTSVAIQEGMDRFELHMRQGSLDQGERSNRIVMQELFQQTHACHHLVRRWRNEPGVSRSAAADPILAPPEFPRALSPPPAAGEQFRVSLRDEAEG